MSNDRDDFRKKGSKLPQAEIERRKKVRALKEKLLQQRDRLSHVAEQAYLKKDSLLNRHVAEEKAAYDQLYEQMIEEEQRVISLCDEKEQTKKTDEEE